MKKIAVINQKGGVGKSTNAVNIAYGLVRYARKKTLLIDLDPQNHSGSIYSNLENSEEGSKYTVKDLFHDQSFNPKLAIKSATSSNGLIDHLDIIASNIQFAKVAEQVSSRIHREKILHNHLKKLEYDFVVMDCPPNLGVITINAIYTADLILIPVTYDKGALDGMADLFETIREVKESDDFNYMIIRNMLDARNKQTNAYIHGELEPFSEKMFKTIIRKTEALNQSRMTNEPIFLYDSNSKGTADYKALTEELINHV